MPTRVWNDVPNDNIQTWASFQFERRAALKNRTDLSEAHPKFYAETPFSYFRPTNPYDLVMNSSDLSSSLGFVSRHPWLSQEDTLIYDLCEREWMTSDEGFSKWNQHYGSTFYVRKLSHVIGWLTDEDN